MGCQFSVQCSDLYTRPSCPGPTWRPLTKCEGDYLRFYSDNLQTEVKYEQRFNLWSSLILSKVDEPDVQMDMRFCYKQNVNFTFGLSDNLYVQFKTDKSFRARGFNCSVTCEGFDFSQLFARIPFSEEEHEDTEDDYDDNDYDDEEYETENDYFDNDD